ncbi:MAG: hypothetical protein ACOC0J_02915 [Myxococcota bacterium]
MRRATKALALLIASSLILAGCDLLDLFDPQPPDPVDRVAVGTVLGVPAVELPTGVPALEETTAANLFLGRRGPGVDIALDTPEPLTTAEVTLTIVDEAVTDVHLPHVGDGVYATTSADDATLVYLPGATYRSTIVEGGRIYEMDVEQAPAAEAPSGVPDVHALGQPLTISWTQRRTALVEVHRLSASGAVQTYTNRPGDIRELIHLALQKEPDEPELTIPGDAFLGRGPHVLVLFILSRGFPDSGLFAGSTLMAGAGEAVHFQVD